jgi:type III pantothenate kinase
MLITVCVGNTYTYTGFFVDDDPLVLRLPTKPLRDAGQFKSAIEKAISDYALEGPEAAVLSSVVPAYTEPMKAMLRELTGGKEPLVISHRVIKDMKIAVTTPEALGADRISAGYGAWRLFGGPIAVVDMGTATTVNFITADGVFLGGAILPGVALMRDALKERTAKLPRVELESPPGPLGTNTKESILAGVIYGSAGAVDRIIEEAETERLEKFKVALTGGHAELMAPFMKRVDFLEPSLVLKGMRLIQKLAHARA